MSTLHVTVEVDVSDSMRELRRLGSDPDFSVVLSFESAVLNQFGVTEADVHVDTGSLKMSGRWDTDYRNGVFEGVISFGGPSPGVHDPVTYAIDELDRGDDHFFFNQIQKDGYGEQEYIETILDHFRGRPR